MISEELPLLSIIIPVYNASEYIECTWDSLRKQSYSNLEFVFVDDCSTDTSFDFLVNISKEDHRVILTKTEKNSGVSYARNVGIKESNGTLIGFCDADDTCDKDMFESLVNALLENDADIACCGLKRCAPDGKVVDTLWEAPQNTLFSSEQALQSWLLAMHIGNSVYTKVTKKYLWEGLFFPEGEIYEEAQVIPTLFHRAKVIVHSGKNSYNYYIREGSYTTAIFNEKKLVVYKRERYIEQFIMQNYPELEKDFMVYKIRTNLNLMIEASLKGDMIDSDLKKVVRREFNNIVIDGLKSDSISIKKKINILELYFGLFRGRKILTDKLKKRIF